MIQTKTFVGLDCTKKLEDWMNKSYVKVISIIPSRYQEMKYTNVVCSDFLLNKIDVIYDDIIINE